MFMNYNINNPFLKIKDRKLEGFYFYNLRWFQFETKILGMTSST